LDLELLLTSPAAFGLTTATPLQRAICRAAEGKALGLGAGDVQSYFGVEPKLGLVPSLIVLVCGVRSGKSLIAVCAALFCSLTANLAQLLPHERARTVIVAPTLANAETTFRLLVGAINTAPALKAVVVGEPTNDKVTVRRSDGRFVDIVVVAAHRGAVALRGTWLAGFILEETAFFGADATGYVVNAEELLRAASTRLVPGGQGWVISSPMGPSGLLHDLWKTHFGKPGKVLVAHAPTLAMNSVTVNRDMIDEIRKRDPDAAAREYDALWSDADTVLVPAIHIDACVGPHLEIPYHEGQSYVAAMDPATRGNAWTLVVATKNLEKPMHTVCLARQWVGSKVRPLDPNIVLHEIADILKSYELDRCATDQWAADANKAIARNHGLYLYDISASQVDNVEIYTSMATKFADKDIEIPPDPYIRNDLLGIRKKVSSRISIVLAKTPDGRHCDYAPPLARVLAMGCSDPVAVRPKAGTQEYWDMLRAEEKAWAMQEAAKRARKENKELNKAARTGNWRKFHDE